MGGNGEHHGGDSNLMRNFVDVIRREDASHTTLADGILSASMCVAAQASEENGTFEPVSAYASTKSPV